MFNQPAANERRQFSRLDFAQPVTLGFSLLEEVKGGLSADLSEGGLRLSVSQFIPLQTELTVKLQFKDKAALEVPAKVVWVEQKRHSEWFQIGVEFLPVDSLVASRRQIQTLIK